MPVKNICCEEKKCTSDWPYPCLIKNCITDRVYLVWDKYLGTVVQGDGIGEASKKTDKAKSWHSEPHCWKMYEGTVTLCNSNN